MTVLRLLGSLLIGALVGCASVDGTADPAGAPIIAIGDSIDPMVLSLRAGREVQIENRREGPIRIGVLASTVSFHWNCGRGVTSWFTEGGSTVTLDPSLSIRLCLGGPGYLDYNVWFEPDNPRGPISRTARVQVPWP